MVDLIVFRTRLETVMTHSYIFMYHNTQKKILLKLYNIIICRHCSDLKVFSQDENLKH